MWNRKLIRYYNEDFCRRFLEKKPNAKKLFQYYANMFLGYYLWRRRKKTGGMNLSYTMRIPKKKKWRRPRRGNRGRKRWIIREVRTRRWFFFRRTRGLRKWGKFIGRKRTHSQGFSSISFFYNRPSSLLLTNNFARSFEEARYLVRWGFCMMNGVVSRDRVPPRNN